MAVNSSRRIYGLAARMRFEGANGRGFRRKASAIEGANVRGFRRKASAMEGENGSISVLTIGLFLLAVALLVIITDIGSLIVAKRSLIHITESAGIRATHQLDLAEYYRGVTNVEIPINCEMALATVNDELGQWITSQSEMKRRELTRVELLNFSCNGNRIELTTSAEAKLPFPLPGAVLPYVELHATVGVESRRKR